MTKIVRQMPIVLKTGALLLMALFTLSFVIHAADFGQAGLRNALPEPHRLQSDSVAANLGIFAHMITGAIITLLAPFQLMGPLRHRWPTLHRLSGRILVTTAFLTAICGLTYIALRGTIGGPMMNIGFSLYGILLLYCAVETIRYARKGAFDQHRAMALRLFWLAMGSWLYRVHYALWYAATGGLWSNRQFSGAFDHCQNFGFYLPYLLGVQVYLFWIQQGARQRDAIL